MALSRALLAVVGALCLTVATAAVSSPPLNSSNFKAGADGELYIGGEFGDDGFFAIVGALGKCDAAGFASGSAKLSGNIGNLTLEEFPVTVRYACGKLENPRWMPQATITGTSAAAVSAVNGLELTDFKITVAAYAHSLSSWMFGGSVKGMRSGESAEFIFDSRFNEWSKAEVLAENSTNMKIAVKHGNASVCTSVGQFLDGTVEVTMKGRGIGGFCVTHSAIFYKLPAEEREREEKGEKRFRVYREAPGFRPGPCVV